MLIEHNMFIAGNGYARLVGKIMYFFDYERKACYRI